LMERVLGLPALACVPATSGMLGIALLTPTYAAEAPPIGIA
jgi:hypothetical protein